MGKEASPNIVVKHLLSDMIMRSKLIQSQKDLDMLLNEATITLTQAINFQSRTLSESEVAERWHFLDGKKLQNMRYRHCGPKYLKFGDARNSRVFYKVSDVEEWIVSHYQLEPFVQGLVKPYGSD